MVKHDALALQQYLTENIPITAAMGVRVVEAHHDRVRIAAPLAPNTNHRDTVFGGSAVAVAILAAWTLLHTRLTAEGIVSRLVIQRSHMDYVQPIAGDFVAVAAAPEEQAWQRFVGTLARRGRARITVTAELRCESDPVAAFTGDFVAVLSDRAVSP